MIHKNSIHMEWSEFVFIVLIYLIDASNCPINPMAIWEMTR